LPAAARGDLEEIVAGLRREAPLVADASVDVVVSKCVLNLVDAGARRAMFRELFRVLRPGGRAVISDIVSDCEVPEALRRDPVLWSGCISGALTESGFLDATTMMEYLIQKGVPQRRAHHLIGELVADAISAGKSLAELSVEKLQSLAPELDEAVQGVLGSHNAVKCFRSEGSTSPAHVAREIQRWQAALRG